MDGVELAMMAHVAENIRVARVIEIFTRLSKLDYVAEGSARVEIFRHPPRPWNDWHEPMVTF